MFSSSPKLINAYFPDGLNRVFTASDVVQGSISLRIETEGKEGKMRHKLESVHAKLRVMMITSYYHRRPGVNNGVGQPNYNGANQVDHRVQTTQLHGEDLVLWNSSNAPFPDPNSPPPTIQIPFRFVLPRPELNLPPSFEGGSRGGGVNGHEVARIVYFIKISGHKTGTFSFDERLTLPFLYMPPSIVDASYIPPPIVPRDQQRSPVAPRQPSQQEGWFTMIAEKDYREKLFGKKNKIIIKLTIPSLPAFPRTISIPYHLSILVLAPEEKGQTTLALPSPSELRISLTRTVNTTANGGSQKFDQSVGLLTDLKSENRVWYQPQGWRDEKGEKRWVGEIVVVGEFAVGGAATPTFSGGTTRGLLSCDYSVRLDLPLKGPMNDLDVDHFFNLVISSNQHIGQQQYWINQQPQKVDMPSEFFSVDDDLGDHK